MNLASFSVKRPITVLMGTAAVILVGAVCLMRLPIDLLPDISFPVVSVRTSWPNVSPEEMERLISRPIEQAVSSATNIYRVSSESELGQSQVRIEFNYGTNMDTAAVEVLQLVERARERLPDDATLRSPVVYKFDPNNIPVMRFGLSSPGDPVAFRRLVDEQVVPRLEAVNGVGAAEVVGGVEREIRVEVDLERLRARGLTLGDISRRLAQENSNTPGGLAKQGNTEFLIRSMGLFERPSEVENVILTSYGGQAVYVRDVAKVVDGPADQRVVTRLNGEPAIGIWIRKQSTANTVETAHALMTEVRSLQQDYPQIGWGIPSDFSRFIEQTIHHTQREALIGAMLAILIILLFLRNVRSTLVIGLSIPISVLATFGLFYLCNFTLNVMSLGGLALGVGLIVDDAIVVLENIYRHIERDGATPREAAVGGTNEVAMAVVAATVTVMVVFLPLLFVRGVTGQMYLQFALAVVFSIGVSLIMAMTVVPMLASRMVHSGGGATDGPGAPELNGNRPLRPVGIGERLFLWSGRQFDRLDERYRGVLRWALRHRVVTLVIAMATLGLSLLLYPMVGTELMPKTDNGDFNVSYRLPTGSALAVTNTHSQQIEERLRNLHGVQTVFATVGGSGWNNRPTSNQMQTTVRLKSGEGERASTDVMGEARKALGSIPGEVRVSQFDLVSRLLTGGDNIELKIFGRDTDQLVESARDVMERVRTVPGLSNLDISWQPGPPELRVVVDRAKAAQFGLSFADIAGTVEAATEGVIPTYFEENGSQYRFRVRAIEEQRQTVESLGNILVRAGATQLTSQIALPRGSQIRLNQVARIEVASGPSRIERMNRERFVSVNGVPVDRPLGDVVAEIESRLQGYKLPEGYRFQWGGAQEQVARNFADLYLAVGLAILLIYMVLAAQFESFVHPLTIMFSVPLSIVGVLLALFLTGRAFGMTAFIGLLMLVGIVVKNAILLVDYTNVLRERGMDRDAAILQAGPTRLRPILMTTGATILGMFPLAMGMGKGTETQAPMATAVIGGLITSTLLTLVVIPVVYTVLDDLQHRRRFGRPRIAERAPSMELERGETDLLDRPTRAGGRPIDPGAEPVRRMEGDAAG
jgi:HAE1 family hydrophobic/amphiphilic exporter-1